MPEEINVAWAKHKAAAQLKRVPPQLVLVMAGSARPRSRFRVLAPQKMKKIRGFQLHDFISLSLFIDQERKGDGSLLAKLPRVDSIAQAYGGEGRSFVAEELLVFAQLRDVLATKNSSIVPQENEDSRLFVPQRSEPDFPAIAIGERYESQFVAERIVHGFFIIRSTPRSVKRAKLPGGHEVQDLPPVLCSFLSSDAKVAAPLTRCHNPNLQRRLSGTVGMTSVPK